eukprot:3491428-Rhodomonas_salina.1
MHLGLRVASYASLPLRSTWSRASAMRCPVLTCLCWGQAPLSEKDRGSIPLYCPMRLLCAVRY